jgi:hypothetical protein
MAKISNIEIDANRSAPILEADSRPGRIFSRGLGEDWV